MSDDNPDQGPLEELRGELDRVDHELLTLLVERMGIVGDIASRKRTHRVPIRDLGRERRILDDRCARAAALGLAPESIESIWRQLMLMSRERQAALRAEVPTDLASKKVAIVGGAGGMGRSLSTLFADLGHEVLIADLDTELTPRAAARAADVVVISVPIRDTRSVIEELGPELRSDALLMDVTSLKSDPMDAMMNATKASVCGTHPMFGPGVNTYQGQRVVLCPGRGDEWLDWVRQMFRARGLIIAETTPAEHDAMMAIVQVLHHFKTQVLGLALSRLGVPLEETLRYTSPAYLLETYVTGRHFAQSPELYGPIEMLNPESERVTAAFREAAEALAAILQAGDQVAFDQVFAEVRGFFGDFSAEALEQSGFLIDRLVELSAGRQS
ncbi:MAG: bifunctional chorismate mutase/prephenate dehydrogenase [Polyangiales bacterium]